MASIQFHEHMSLPVNVTTNVLVYQMVIEQKFVNYSVYLRILIFFYLHFPSCIFSLVLLSVFSFPLPVSLSLSLFLLFTFYLACIISLTSVPPSCISPLWLTFFTPLPPLYISPLTIFVFFFCPLGSLPLNFFSLLFMFPFFSFPAFEPSFYIFFSSSPLLFPLPYGACTSFVPLQRGTTPLVRCKGNSRPSQQAQLCRVTRLLR